MKRKMHRPSILALALALLLALPLAAQNNNTSGQKLQGKNSGNTAGKLAVLELPMQQSAGKDAKAYLRTQGEYWAIISEQNDFGRAYESL